ncbi:MAG: flagellar assembly protein FliW [Deltaproteobacteria bacterium]|nr:flagellar assembly protein FliW [Deltaproteobacteria bacterium]
MENRQEIETRLGKQVVDLDKVIHFPRGIIGFEDRKRFTLLQIRPEAPFLVLQSMDDPGLGLLVADPYGFMPEYTLKIGDAEQKLLQVDKREDLAVLVTVAIPPGKPEETVISLTGPILINHAAKIGIQVPQTDIKGPTKLKLNTADLTPIQ